MIERKRGGNEAYRLMVEDEKKEESELNAYHQLIGQLAFAVLAFFHAWILFFPVCPLIAGTILGEPYLSCSTDKELSAHRVSQRPLCPLNFTLVAPKRRI
jgi:hypothetical protein